MRAERFFIAVFLTAVSVVSSAGAREKAAAAPAYDEVIVRFEEGADAAEILKSFSIPAENSRRVKSIDRLIKQRRKRFFFTPNEDGSIDFMGKKYQNAGEIPAEDLFQAIYPTLPLSKQMVYRAYRVRLPEGMDIEKVLRDLAAHPQVERAEPNAATQGVKAFQEFLEAEKKAEKPSAPPA